MRGKGKGWKAHRDIQPGTPILDEEVLFWIWEGTVVNDSFEQLNGFSELSCPAPVNSQRRFDANSFGMGKGTRGRDKHGIFLQASRLNHSCIPNAYFAWNPQMSRSGRLTVYAIVPIPKGAEILINYRTSDSFKDKNQRHQDRGHYGFECACPACQSDSDFGRKSDERRERMGVLNDKIENRVPPTHTIESFSNLIELGNLLQEEGLYYPQLADVYHKQALWWKTELQRITDARESAQYKEECGQKALQAARKELDLDVMCNGYDSPVVKKTLEFIRGVS